MPSIRTIIFQDSRRNVFLQKKIIYINFFFLLYKMFDKYVSQREYERYKVSKLLRGKLNTCDNFRIMTTDDSARNLSPNTLALLNKTFVNKISLINVERSTN